MTSNHANSFNFIRLIAAVQVVLVHIFNHHNVENVFISAIKVLPGVPIFFFVSGLMIYGSYNRNRSVGVFSFYANRFLRIYPGLWVCVFLSIAMLFPLGYLSFQLLDVKAFLFWVFGQTSFFQFYNPDFMRGFGVGVLNGALWTISVELQFYILAPLLYFFASRSKVCLILVFLLSAVMNYIAHYVLVVDSMTAKLLRVSFLPWVFIFIFGFWVGHSERLRILLGKARLIHLLILYILTMFLFGDIVVNSSNAINGFSAIILSSIVYKIGCSSWLSKQWVSGFANRVDLSYGLYLYHMPLINFLMYMGGLSALWNFILTIVLSFLLAVASWYLVEKPSLELKGRFQSRGNKYARV